MRRNCRPSGASGSTNRAAAAVSGLVTPPDAVSMIALLVPMGLLYEVGILAAQVFIKHTQAPAEASE